MLDVKDIEDFAYRVVDEVLNRSWPMIKGRDWWKDNGPHLG